MAIRSNTSANQPAPPFYRLHPRTGGAHTSHRSSTVPATFGRGGAGLGGILVISGRNIDSAIVHSFSGANFLKIGNVRLRLISHIGISPCSTC